MRWVLVERCLWPAEKERVHYRSIVGHDLMKPVGAFKELGGKNYRDLEEYLDLHV